jgi:branched-chain amino acid transport system permease protein
MASDNPDLTPPIEISKGRETSFSDRLMINTIGNPIRLVGMLFLLWLIYIAGYNISAGEYTLEQFVRQAIFGLAQGSIYAVIAVGYTLVYGIMFMINFAHGEVFMAGAYMGFFVINALDQADLLADYTVLVLLITVFFACVASVTIAVLLERIAYRPLRGAPRLVPLITAIGASISLQQLFLRLFGGDPRVYPNVNLYVLPGVFPNLECSDVSGTEVCRGLDLIGGLYKVDFLGMQLRVRPIFFVVFFVAIVLMISLWFIVQRTKTGKSMRAVAEDKPTAALMGINVDRVIVTTFALGAAMAGAGAVLFALYNRQVTPFMGFIPGIKAFTAAVLGGIGNIPGAAFGGLFLGLAESVGPSLLGIPSQLKDVVAFGMLVLILILRPTGIFGEVLSEKKA